MPESNIILLAEKDWEYSPEITGPSQQSDWARAQRWGMNSPYVCRFADSRKCSPGGLRAFARLRGVDSRRFASDISDEPAGMDEVSGMITGEDNNGGNITHGDQKQEL